MGKQHRSIRGLVAGVALTAAIVAGVGVGTAPAGAAATECPAAAGNARFVRFIYLQILYRCPDAGAGTYWTGRLDAGMSRWAFAEAVDMSTENVVHNNVETIYDAFFGRAPSNAERTAGVQEIRTLHQDGHLLAGLLARADYYNGKPGATPQAKDDAWLTDAFQAILDRAPDAAGKAYYLSQLGASGSTVATRNAVALRMEYSTENGRSWVDGVYYGGVNRAPDAAGTQYWLKWLAGKGKHATFQFWTHVLASNEGYALAQTQPNIT